MLPVLLIAGGLGLVAFLLADDDKEVPVHEPDAEAIVSGSTGYRRVDAIMSQLRSAADSSGIPLGLLVGWIARESGGRMDEVTKLDERGLFQLMPSESSSLGLDHQRLTTDVDYSIAAGIALIRKYMGLVDALGVAPRGSSYYWKLVKLEHTMGSGATKKIVEAARAVGAVGSWEDLKKYALDNNAALLSSTKHAPAKWFPLVDAVYTAGAPFGFGSDATAVAGWGPSSNAKFNDIPDPLRLLDKYKK